MTRLARLTSAQSAHLITALRHGRLLDEAAAELRLDLAAVWETARTDTRLVAALAGREPDPVIVVTERESAERFSLLSI